jgi:hypothetical protein
MPGSRPGTATGVAAFKTWYKANRAQANGEAGLTEIAWPQPPAQVLQLAFLDDVAWPLDQREARADHRLQNVSSRCLVDAFGLGIFLPAAFQRNRVLLFADGFAGAT